MKSGVSMEDLNKVKEQQKRKLEVDVRQNSFWMQALHDAYYMGNPPAEILNKQKMVEGLTTKMIQDAAKKYINPNVYIRGVLMPAKEGAKPLKGF
jgi:zinc protease